MADEIHCHDKERELQAAGPFTAQEIIWRPKAGDHAYRGSGTTEPSNPGMITWTPCDVCGKAYGNRKHGNPYRTCSWCGSIHPADALEIADAWGVAHWDWQGVEEFVGALNAGKLGIEWADFKYGWPHKAYLTGRGGFHAKLYTVHLRDVSDEDFPRIAELLNFGGVTWSRDERGTKWTHVE